LAASYLKLVQTHNEDKIETAINARVIIHIIDAIVKRFGYKIS